MKKDNIYNLKTEDIELIKKFIELYELIKEKYEEYTNLCEAIRKNILMQRQVKTIENSSIEEIFEQAKEELVKQYEKETDENRKQLLTNQFETLKTDVNRIKEYKEIEKLYNEMYYGNIKEYFKEEEKKEEEPIKVYTKQETYQKDYYFNKKSTITQIYIILKYIYDFYKTYYIEKKDIYIDFDFVKNNLEFYQLFKEPIKEYLKNNYENINATIKELEEKNSENPEANQIRRIK